MTSRHAWLTTTDLAAELNIRPGTLRQWRSEGKGPRGVRMEGIVRYRRSDVDDWIRQQAGEAA